jgi:hypothetical protein
MKRFTILRSQEALRFLAAFFGGIARECAVNGDEQYARHFARKAASRYFEAL